VKHHVGLLAVSASVLLTTVAGILVFLFFTLLGAQFIFSCGFVVIGILALALLLLFPFRRELWVRILFGFDAVFELLSIGYVAYAFSIWK